MKQTITSVMFSCGQGKKPMLATYERNHKWTRAYKLTGPSAKRLAKTVRRCVEEGHWVCMPHSMGWIAHPLRGRQ